MAEIITVSKNIEGVMGIKSVKSRQMGQKNWVDIEVEISKNKTMTEVHEITQKIHAAIMNTVDGISGITVATYPI